MAKSASALAAPRAALSMEAFVLAICARVAVRFLAIDSAMRLMGTLPRRRSQGGAAIDVHACLEAASIAAARFAHPTCLYRSLIALGLLARRRYPVTIHIGASRDGAFFAHAWLTIAGRPIEPPQLRAYVALWRYSAGNARSA